MGKSANSYHRWKFFQIGGFDQVRLETGNDLNSLDFLDEKLWAALSCPTWGVRFDKRTLDFIDTDGDGRIRVPEVKSAVRWACSVLKDPGEFFSQKSGLPLSSINDDSVEGKQILASAKQILKNLNKPDALEITPEDTSDIHLAFANTDFNGDGIIPEDSAQYDELKAVIRDIISTVGAETDRSGKPGVSEDKVLQFFEEAQAFSDWWKNAEPDLEDVLPLGDKIESAVAIFKSVESKINDYFIRCRMAEFDPKATEALNPTLTHYQTIADKNLLISAEDMAGFPIAKIEAQRPLPLKEGLNPVWISPMQEFNSQVVNPLIGEKDFLTQHDWEQLSGRFFLFENWQNSKKKFIAEHLGIQRVRELLSGTGKESLLALIAQDKALEPEFNAIALVDKLTLYYRDLVVFLNNYVSFQDFYGLKKSAIFQAGELYLDQRCFKLCIPVEDVAHHSTIATLSGTYLLYCDCIRRNTGEKITIVAGVTNGDSDNLMVGRNGVFYDRDGRDWDATVIKIVEHPISIRQAFWMPYKRIARMIEEQIEKFAAAREKATLDKASADVSNVSESAEAGKAPAPSSFDVAKFAGIFAAIGLAIGALGTAMAAILTGFLSLAWWQMPVVIIGVILIISVPSMIIAGLKLRKRNLAPILDANGWAVNTLAKMNIPFGTALTLVAELPKGAKRIKKDPFAEKKRPWKFYLFIVVLISVIVILYRNYELIEKYIPNIF
jgi:hypothetical protein